MSTGWNSGTQTRILVADDHAVVRHGLRLLLDREPDLIVVAEAADGAQAVDLAVESALSAQIDLVILDIAMPRMTGLQAARELARRRPGLPMLILSMYDNDQFLFEALRAGASGYVLKSGADRDIVTACRVATSGGCFLYPSAVTTLAREFLAKSGEEGAADALTPRELQIVKLIAEGHTSRQIAGMLAISVKTVDRHRTNILAKLGLRDRVDLTRYAIRRGLIEP
jgi:DNA-binding NarL/FixJ family response regulator